MTSSYSSSSSFSSSFSSSSSSGSGSSSSSSSSASRVVARHVSRKSLSLSEDVEVRDMVRAWLREVTLDMVCAAVIVVEVLALELVVRLGKLCAWLKRFPETGIRQQQ